MQRRRTKTHKNKSLRARLCRCIKGVAAGMGNRGGEAAAIPICIKSVLHSRGRTIKRFNCGKKKLITQALHKRK